MAVTPIWIRKGYPTQWQYRNAKARKQINPATGKHYTGARQERDQRAKARGKPRDYKRERERANARAATRGFTSESQRRRVYAAARAMGVDAATFDNFRRRNASYWLTIEDDYKARTIPRTFPLSLYYYDEKTNSGRRTAKQIAGYVISYYHAIVDDRYNYYSTLNGLGERKMVIKDIPGHGPSLVPESNMYWRLLMVQYSDYYQAEEYDSRYGVD